MLKTARYYKIAAENKELKEHIKRQRDRAWIDTQDAALHGTVIGGLGGLGAGAALGDVAGLTGLGIGAGSVLGATGGYIGNRIKNKKIDNAINTLSPEEKDRLMNMSSVEAYDYLNKIK